MVTANLTLARKMRDEIRLTQQRVLGSGFGFRRAALFLLNTQGHLHNVFQIWPGHGVLVLPSIQQHISRQTGSQAASWTTIETRTGAVREYTNVFRRFPSSLGRRVLSLDRCRRRRTHRCLWEVPSDAWSHRHRRGPYDGRRLLVQTAAAAVPAAGEKHNIFEVPSPPLFTRIYCRAVSTLLPPRPLMGLVRPGDGSCC